MAKVPTVTVCFSTIVVFILVPFCVTLMCYVCKGRHCMTSIDYPERYKEDNRFTTTTTCELKAPTTGIEAWITTAIQQLGGIKDSCYVKELDDGASIERGCGYCFPLGTPKCKTCEQDYCNKPLYCVQCKDCGPDQEEKFKDVLCPPLSLFCEMWVESTTGQWQRDCGQGISFMESFNPFSTRTNYYSCHEDLCNKPITCYECDNCNVVTSSTPVTKCDVELMKHSMCSLYRDKPEGPTIRTCGSCAYNRRGYTYHNYTCTDCFTNYCNTVNLKQQCYNCTDYYQCEDYLRNGTTVFCNENCIFFQYFEMLDMTYRMCGNCENKQAMDNFTGDGNTVDYEIKRCFTCSTDKCNDGYISDKPKVCESFLSRSTTTTKLVESTISVGTITFDEENEINKVGDDKNPKKN